MLRPVGNIPYDDARRIGDSLGRSSERVRLGANYEVSFEAFHRNWCDRFGVTCDRPWPEVDLEYFKMSHRFRLEAGVVAMLERLRSSGVRMGIVSNSFHAGSSLQWMVEQGGIQDYFEFLISSADYGFRKPHPEIFETAIARLGLPREDVWFVGDRLELDVLGAKGVGLTAVWYNADGEAPGDVAPDVVISSLDEFGG